MTYEASAAITVLTFALIWFLSLVPLIPVEGRLGDVPSERGTVGSRELVIGICRMGSVGWMMYGPRCAEAGCDHVRIRVDIGAGWKNLGSVETRDRAVLGLRGDCGCGGAGSGSDLG